LAQRHARIFDAGEKTMGTEPIIAIDNLHACIAVENLEESIDWYRNVMGFNVFQRADYPDYSTRGAFLKSKGVELELVESKTVLRSRRQDPPFGHLTTQGISQLSIRVSDLAGVAERLKSRSIPIVFGPAKSSELRLEAFFIRDNEGNLIEFIERF
jgi:methylmalonyl-CoA/ethylmalonyl-CoA epimerase